MKNTSKETVHYELPERLDASKVQGLRADLIEKRGESLELSGTLVRMFGAHCGEILLAAARTWREDGIPLSISGASVEMLFDIELLGLSLADFTSPEPAR